MHAVVPPWPESTQKLRLGALQIDLRYRRVLRADGEIELPARVFDLLVLFLAEPGVLHQRAQLLARVWSNVVVEDASLSQAIWTLRNALGAPQRDWIRTVSKSGYVFEPDVAIAPLAPDAVPAPEEITLEHISAQRTGSPAALVASHRSARPRGSALRHGAIAGLFVTLLLGGLYATQGGRQPRAVAILQIADAAAASDAHWPATLLRQWTEWKLAKIPDVTLLARDHLAADHGNRDEIAVVLVSSGEIPGQQGRWFVQAQYEFDGSLQRQRLEGRHEEMPQLTARLSTTLIERLLPDRRRQPWPALQISAPAAKDYASFVVAYEARNWSRAGDLGRTLVTRAPQFGLVHSQLAQVQLQLGQIREAQRLAEQAASLLQPLADDAREILQAERLTPAPNPELALRAYAELARKYPAQAQFALALSRQMLRADRPADALAVLDRSDWSNQSIAIRHQQLQIRARAMLMLGDGKGARESAGEAYRLAEVAGWEWEMGDALLSLASSDIVELRGVVNDRPFAQAAAHFHAAGDEMRASEAKLLEASRGSGRGPDIELEHLLAQAHAAGHRALEIKALRIAAFRKFRAGDLNGYRDLLGQALAVAEAVGDQLALRRFDLDLLVLDIDAGDFAAADIRLQRLDQSARQGEIEFWVQQMAMVLALRRGQFDIAEARLSAASALMAADPGRPAVTALILCMRGQLELIRGRVGPARSAMERCGNSPAPVYQVMGQIGLSRLDLYTGDRESALRRLLQARDQVIDVPSVTDQRGLWAEIADVAVEAGAADVARPLLIELLQAARTDGMRTLEAETRLALARLAAEEGRWSEVVAAADAARTLAAADDWSISSALTMLSALRAAHEGQSLQAAEQLAALAHAALERGDALTEVEAQALLHRIGQTPDCCIPRGRLDLIARSGLQGLIATWRSAEEES